MPQVNGDLSGLRRPESFLERATPHTMLKKDITAQARWTEVDKGTFYFADHVNLGEIRTVVRLMRRLVGITALHGKILEDNARRRRAP